MGNKLEGSFNITSWDETPHANEDGSSTPTHAKISLDYFGGIEGSSDLQYLISYRPDGTFQFVGLGVVVGKVGEMTGSFVLQHTGTFESGLVQGTYSVVPSTGTGELARLSGSGLFEGKSGKGKYFVDFSA